jgi:acyl carrier protein
MFQIMLISELEGNYGTIIDLSDLENLNTLSDLISFLDKNLSK